MSYEISNATVLKFNLARGFRAPSIPELASNGAHEGTNRYEYGEQDLKSENSFQVDAGVDVNTTHVSFTASLFYNAVQNFIYYRKLSAVAVVILLLPMGPNSFLPFGLARLTPIYMERNLTWISIRIPWTGCISRTASPMFVVS